MPVPFVNHDSTRVSEDGSPESTGRKTPPISGTPPLDANAAPFMPSHMKLLADAAFDSSALDPFWNPQPNDMHVRMAAAKAKKAIEQAAQEHPGWSAVASQMDGRKPMQDRPKVRSAGPSSVEKQRQLVAACVKARSRPLTHTAPPPNLAELHRAILEAGDEPKRALSEDLTPRFPPSNAFEESAAPGELPRILGRSAALQSPKTEGLDLGLDLKFLDDDETPPDAASAEFLRSLANPFQAAPAPAFGGIPVPETPPAGSIAMPPTMPPQPRFLRPREASAA